MDKNMVPTTSGRKPVSMLTHGKMIKHGQCTFGVHVGHWVAKKNRFYKNIKCRVKTMTASEFIR